MKYFPHMLRRKLLYSNDHFSLIGEETAMEKIDPLISL